MNRKWWGWGDPNKRDEIESHPELFDFLKKRLNLPAGARCPCVEADQIKLPEGRLSKGLLGEMVNICGPEMVCVGAISRLTHSAGMGYKDLLRIRRGVLSDYVDAVVYPESEEEVLQLLRLCEGSSVQVIPYGGGSSVVGSFEVFRRNGQGVVSMDLGLMGRLVRVDTVSLTATFEAGVIGPDLESQLAAHGLTLGHFPQSFEYSTLGGWIATRSAGSSSNIYGGIEEMVLSLRVATPKGIIEPVTVPRSAAGPDLRELFLGSEGTLGVITQATLAVHRAPPARGFSSYLFKSFEDGLACVRELVQGGLRATTLRLSDANETNSFYHSKGEAVATSSKVKEAVGLWLVSKKGLSFEDGSLLIAIHEGDAGQVESDRARVKTACRSHHGFGLGSSPAEAWLESRFEQPYLRDSLVEHGVMVDTLETATVWSGVGQLHDAVAVAITTELEKRGRSALVMCHLSHMYPTGSSLYFTFMAGQEPGNEVQEWEAVKEAASMAIVSNGGTITHHHGVGSEHSRWMPAEVGEQGLSALTAVKASLDPKGIMNPGKLLPNRESKPA
jgi:alkyldihydroxyacetonephosphate synthase